MGQLCFLVRKCRPHMAQNNVRQVKREAMQDTKAVEDFQKCGKLDLLNSGMTILFIADNTTQFGMLSFKTYIKSYFPSISSRIARSLEYPS